MKNKLDTNWFKLENYNGLEDLDLLGWHRQISLRNYLNYELFLNIDVGYENLFQKESVQSRLEKSNSDLLKYIERIKCKPIIESSEEFKGFDFKKSKFEYPFNTPSVKSMAAFAMHFLGNDELLSDIWEKCDLLKEDMKITPEQAKLIETPYDLLCNNRGNNEGYQVIVETKGYAHISIDLSATDEQIKQDFGHWLKEYKKVIGCKSIKTTFTKNDFNKWVEQRLLQCFDLMLIAKIEGKKITQEDMIGAVFWDESESLNEDQMRKTRLKNANNLMDDQTLFAIQAQLESISPKR